MMSCAISGYIGVPLEITSQHLTPHYDIYPIFFQPSSPTLFSLHKCLHLCFHHTYLVQDRSGVFTHTRRLHGIIHSFISLLLRSMAVPTAQIFTARSLHHTCFFDVIEPCPEGILKLLIRCFHPDSNPFPNDKQYKVVEAPTILLEHGCQVYLPGYGVVHLLEIAVKKTRRLKGWKAFQCVQGRVVVAEVAVRKEWCKIPERHMGFCGMSFSFFHFF